MEEIRGPAPRLPAETREGWGSRQQRELFIDLFRIPFVAENFWLAGGTCLSAMYLRHRQSEDIDLFTTRPDVHPGERQTIVDLLRTRYVFDAPFSIHPNYVSMMIDGIKVDFVSDPFAYRTARPRVVLEGVSCVVDSWENLCVAKFSAFLSRTSAKDIADLSAILGTVKDDHEFQVLADFLIRETRKRDAMADELTLVADLLERTSLESKDSAARRRFSKLRECVADIEDAVRKEIFPSP